MAQTQLQMIQNIADKLVKELEAKGVGAYIWHRATTGSVYIRFEDNRIGSVRIGNHEGREKLKYKFNIRTDLRRSSLYWIKEEGRWRCFCPLEKWLEIIPVLVDNATKCKALPPSEHRYFIPKFKNQESKK